MISYVKPNKNEKNFPKPKCKTQTCLGSTPNATRNMSQI